MSNNKYKVLIIEDEPNIQTFVKAILEANDYQVITAGTFNQGKLMFFSHLPDLVILDLGLPDTDGLEFIRLVRLSHATPIIILSARVHEADKVKALDLGANDYVTKPFGTAELLARVRACLRNHRSNLETLPSGVFHLQDLEIDYGKRQVRIGGEEVKLTQTEYNIVALLSEHTGSTMTYSMIIQAIWGCADSGSVKKLQVNMANIRKKLGVRPGQGQYITNELGVGYRMLDENE